MSRIPAYERVYQQLKREINEGELLVGDFLPPEPQLEKKFEVSRTTIRKAIELLVNERLVIVKQGRGTQVIDFRTQQNLNKVTSISETLVNKGYEVTSRSMYIDRIEASSSLAVDFQIEKGQELIRVQRVQLADNKPIAIMKNYLLPSMVSGIEDYVNRFSSLYQFIEDTYNIKIDSAQNRITARSSNFSESEMLGLKPNSPLLYIKRVCYQGEQPVCVDRISLAGDKYEFQVQMEGRGKGLDL